MAPPTTPEQDDFPANVGEGTRMILDALEGWRHEDRERQDAKHAENAARMDSFERELKAVSAAVKLGYPDGDADAHRRYHELLIAREEQRQTIRQEVITHVLKTSTWLMLAGLAMLLIKQFKEWIFK